MWKLINVNCLKYDFIRSSFLGVEADGVGVKDSYNLMGLIWFSKAGEWEKDPLEKVWVTDLHLLLLFFLFLHPVINLLYEPFQSFFAKVDLNCF